MLRLAAASGILEVLQVGGLGAEELLGLERYGFELSAKACKTCSTLKSLRVSRFCMRLKPCQEASTASNLTAGVCKNAVKALDRAHRNVRILLAFWTGSLSALG